MDLEGPSGTSGHHRRSRAARRLAERECRSLHGGQDCVRRSVERRQLSGHRSLGVCQPEMGAANAGCRGGICRRHAAFRHPVHRARAQPCRARPGACRVGARSSDLRGRIRNVQPTEHQPDHRAVAGRVCARRGARTGQRTACSRIPVDRVRVSLRGPRSTGEGRRHCRTPDGSGRVRGRPQRHDRDRPSRTGAPGPRAGPRTNPRRSRCASFSRHARHGTRERADGADNRRRHVRCVRRRAGGCPYAPGAAGNLATDDLIYMLDGLGIETGVSLPALSKASAFIAARLDHRLPSRYFQALSSVPLSPKP